MVRVIIDEEANNLLKIAAKRLGVKDRSDAIRLMYQKHFSEDSVAVKGNPDEIKESLMRIEANTASILQIFQTGNVDI